ncbi:MULTISPECIES: hypothetical protein [unclassified Rhodococcus (in: high G+C Gram-positive bacteria)]|uniref:hypothetical protein n=1 Tax=unclassified Rhodococcus (in: high G+C Gram-positive bacteria) TaxID=192944 RepID=UPI001F3C70BF|nr:MULTISPECIES: hypothetical protein [unclassified Rhodococcus (in: high G+C Gram-positive bacteria)]
MSELQGRYRPRVMPLPLTVCRHLVWRAVKDPVAVVELLEPIMSIGKKRRNEEGQCRARSRPVLEITEQPDADSWALAHLHPDGGLGAAPRLRPVRTAPTTFGR